MIGSMRAAILAMAAAVVLAACSSPVRLMPTPTLLVGADAASSDFVPEPERSPDIEIYYATNRLPVDSAAERRYSRQIGSKLHFGIDIFKRCCRLCDLNPCGLAMKRFLL